MSRLSRRTLLAAAATGLAPTLHAQGEASALARVRERGRLSVAVYHDMPPFHQGGQGIDVEIARALAASLGVSLSLLPFTADENMNDDLRNMVWRGHLLGHGPADVLLHVPVDPPLMQGNPRVQIFAPYWRERIVIARDREQLPRLETLDDLGSARVAVPGQTLAGWLMIGAEGGRWRNQLVTRMNNGQEACELMRRGEVAAAAGMLSELESALAGDARYAITPLPLPRARDGWAVGMAVKKDATDLARALQAAINDLGSSGRMAQIFAAVKLRWAAP